MVNFARYPCYIFVIIIAFIIFQLRNQDTWFYKTFMCNTEIKNDEKVIIYPTYGYFDETLQMWQLEIHGIIFEEEKQSHVLNAISDLILHLFIKWGIPTKQLSEKERELFQERIWLFLVDNEGCKSPEFMLGSIDDPQPSFPLFLQNVSQPNGHFQHFFQLDTDTITSLIKTKNENENQKNKKLNIQTTSNDGRIFKGTINLISQDGISVISDIDDTIKETGILDKKRATDNTFLKDFVSAPNMKEFYERLSKEYSKEEISFHYVSGSPWQLFDPLYNHFQIKEKFPEGSYHLKYVRIKEIKTLKALLHSQINFKLNYIDQIFKNFPKRKFILIGDSGEQDPEIYQKLQEKFPNQVYKIYIRHFSEFKNTPSLEICKRVKDMKNTTVFIDIIDSIPVSFC